MTTTPDVLVIGAGVIGLSSALALLDAGLAVSVYASEPPHRTTSAVAGALWGPHLVGADERVGPWAAVTLERFRELAGEPQAGIREVRGTTASLTDGGDPGDHASGGDPSGIPAFAQGAGPMTRCDPAVLPPGYASGWAYSAPVVTMPVYLDWLLDAVLRQGGRLELGRPLADLAQAQAESAAPVIVNCTGSGARDLIPDPGLTPVRGQVVVVANPGISEFFVGERERPDEVTYFFPHGATVLLGGTQQPGQSSRTPDPAIAQRILRQCAEVEPRLADAPVLAHRAGLRPVRAQVRLEVQALPGRRHMVHNYGHGGAGVTLSWGCARSVAAQAATLLGIAAAS